MDRSTRGITKGIGGGASEAAMRREWAAALGWAGGMAAAAVVVGAAVNPALGRSVHWDRMAVLAAVLFVALAVALRRRWL